jgi:hypothetical protein
VRDGCVVAGEDALAAKAVGDEARE